MSLAQELNNLDFNNIGSASTPVKLVVIIFLATAIIGGGYYFFTKKQIVALDAVEAKEIQLRQTFEVKVKKAANLEEYKVQLEEMRKTFGTLLRQLPSKTEVPALIVDISQTALASGLEISLFRPGNDIEREFYAEKPIELVMTGDYHQFAAFASEIAALPRIVTLHNINLVPDDNNSTSMTMRALAKTYRYLEDEQ